MKTRITNLQTFDACNKVEDEIMRLLRARGLDEHSPARAVREALPGLPTPAWCDAEPWARMLTAAACWAQAHGNLEIWCGLGRIKQEAVEGFLRNRRARTGVGR